jgi:hypothetical protein
MDILTPKGQKTLEDEDKARKIFEAHYPAFKYVQTPKNKPADVDAILVRDGVVAGVVETKCRYDCDLTKFRTTYGCRWLVTYDKLVRGAELSESLCVPFVGFLYIVQSNVLLIKTLFQHGNWTVDIRVEETRTQRTVNGDTIVRTNGYVDMSDSRVLPW